MTVSERQGLERELERLRGEVARLQRLERHTRDALEEHRLEREVARLQVLLERTTRQLEELQADEPAPARLHFGAEAVDALSARVRAEIGRLVASGELVPPSGDPLGWQQGLDALGRAMSRATAAVMEAERERHRREHERQRGERASQLERRAVRLQEQLRERTHRLIQRRRAVEEADLAWAWGSGRAPDGQVLGR